MKTWHLVVDVALCQGCHNCMLACKDEHVGNDWPGYSRPQPLHGVRWIEVPVRERGRYPLVDVAYRPTLCTHCGDAPCVARSRGAIYKRTDGIVLIDPDKARGRRELVQACPYGHIRWDEESSTPQKCTLCAHLLDKGWSQPRCVQACGPGALSIVYEEAETFAERASAEGLVVLHRGPMAGETGSVPAGTATSGKAAAPGSAEAGAVGPDGAGGPVSAVLVHTGVLYKNLWRFEACFIAGSVAVCRGGTTDCGAGARVTLRKPGQRGESATAEQGGESAKPGQTSPGFALVRELPATVVTDAFGDFRFDGLQPRSGEYEVEVSWKDCEPLRLSVTLGDSVSLGTLLFDLAEEHQGGLQGRRCA